MPSKTIPKDQIHTFRTVRAYLLSGGSPKTAYIDRWLTKYGLTVEDCLQGQKPAVGENMATSGAAGGVIGGAIGDTMEDKLRQIGLV